MVSTHERTILPGPRVHILGSIHGFEANKWEVSPYIVGDWMRYMNIADEERGPHHHNTGD